MKNKYSILVTGCGDDIGQSIGKILKNNSLVNSLYGIDINDKTASRFIVEFFSLGLPCNHKNYINSLETFINKNKIDLIIPISESELRFLSKNNFSKFLGSALLINASSKAQAIGFDKYKTVMFLKENKLPHPQTYLISEINSEIKFPIILKSRECSGSSKVHLIKDLKSFNFMKKKYPNFIVQEYINDLEGEYTCCAYMSSKKEFRNIIFQRELLNGYSSYGKIIENKKISLLLEEIANKLDLIGSINIQLRLKGGIPFVFEINPRFSSTVLFRHMVGFKDLIWSIEDALGLQISKYRSNNVGLEFFKGFSEYIK